MKIADSPLLDIKNLHVHFTIREGLLQTNEATVKAVNGLSITLDAGDIFGLVGESGCGKTTLGRAVVGLAPITSGEVCFNRLNIVGLSGREAYERARHIQLIFQDPYSSLHPRKTVRDLVGEGRGMRSMSGYWQCWNASA